MTTEKAVRITIASKEKTPVRANVLDCGCGGDSDCGDLINSGSSLSHGCPEGGGDRGYTWGIFIPTVTRPKFLHEELSNCGSSCQPTVAEKLKNTSLCPGSPTKGDTLTEPSRGQSSLLLVSISKLLANGI